MKSTYYGMENDVYEFNSLVDTYQKTQSFVF